MYSDTLDFWKKLECSDPFLRVLFLNFDVWSFLEEAKNLFLFSDCASNIFRKGYPRMSANLLTVSVQSVFFCLFWSPWGFPIFLSVCMITEFFRDLDCTKCYQFLGGCPKFLEGLLCSCQICPGSLLTDFYSLYRDGEGFYGINPFSLMGFLEYLSLLVFCEEYRIK